MSACSGVPDCASSDAKDLINEIAIQHKLFKSDIKIKSPRWGDTSLAMNKIHDNERKIRLQKLSEQAQEDEKSVLSEEDEKNGLYVWRRNQSGNMVKVKVSEKWTKLNEENSYLSQREDQEDDKNLKLMAVEFDEAYDNSRFQFENIILTDKNENTGTVECKANLKLEVVGWGGVEAEKQYKIEGTSDGKLYATLYR